MHIVSLSREEFEAVRLRRKQGHVLHGEKFAVGEQLRLVECESGSEPTGRVETATITYITCSASPCALSPIALTKGFSVVSFNLD